MWLRLEKIGQLREVYYRNWLVFATKVCKCLWVSREEMQDVTNGAAGRIMAHEGKEADLADGEGAELRLKALWNSVRHGCPQSFREMSLKYQIDDCFSACLFSICEVFAVALVELVADTFVHFIPFHQCTVLRTEFRYSNRLPSPFSYRHQI